MKRQETKSKSLDLAFKKIYWNKYQYGLCNIIQIDPENLPDFLGGKVSVEEYGENLEKEQGPWVQIDQNQE